MELKDRNDLIERHINLVKSIARRLGDRRTYDDLLAAGYLGLVEAAQRRNDTGGPFPAYAGPRIVGQMRDCLRSLNWRHRRRGLPVVPLGDMEPAWSEAPGPNEFFDKATRCLSPDARAAVHWFYRDGLTCKEVGRRLGVGESRASQVLSESRDVIRRSVSEQSLRDEMN